MYINYMIKMMTALILNLNVHNYIVQLKATYQAFSSLFPWSYKTNLGLCGAFDIC